MDFRNLKWAKMLSFYINRVMGSRFKIQRESEARMLIRLTPPERGKMRASVLKNDL